MAQAAYPTSLARSSAALAAFTHALSDVPVAAEVQGRLRVLSCLESLAAVRTAPAFLRWAATDLQLILPHGMMLCGVVELRQRDFKPSKILQGQWPSAWLDSLRRSDNSVYSPLMERWMAAQSPQFFDPRKDEALADSAWMQLFKDLQLGNLALHGQRDINSPMSSFFAFARIPEDLGADQACLLNLLVPQMHAALMRCLAKVPACWGADQVAAVRLTPREREVLGWMIEGKTNWEIAQIAGRSEHTVRHQVARLLAKLTASNRAQAVAKAIAMKLHV